MTESHWLEREAHRATALVDAVRTLRHRLDELESVQLGMRTNGLEPQLTMAKEMTTVMEQVFIRVREYDKWLRAKQPQRKVIVAGWVGRDFRFDSMGD